MEMESSNKRKKPLCSTKTTDQSTIVRKECKNIPENLPEENSDSAEKLKVRRSSITRRSSLGGLQSTLKGSLFL